MFSQKYGVAKIIISFCPLRELIKTMLVCKAWNTLTDKELIGRDNMIFVKKLVRSNTRFDIFEIIVKRMYDKMSNGMQYHFDTIHKKSFDYSINRHNMKFPEVYIYQCNILKRRFILGKGAVHKMVYVRQNVKLYKYLLKIPKYKEIISKYTCDINDEIFYNIDRRTCNACRVKYDANVCYCYNKGGKSGRYVVTSDTIHYINKLVKTNTNITNKKIGASDKVVKCLRNEVSRLKYKYGKTLDRIRYMELREEVLHTIVACMICVIILLVLIICLFIIIYIWKR